MANIAQIVNVLQSMILTDTKGTATVAQAYSTTSSTRTLRSRSTATSVLAPVSPR